MLRTTIEKNFDGNVVIVAPQRVHYMENFVRYSEMSCCINVNKKELSFDINFSWEYEDGEVPDSESEELTPVYTFEQFANDLTGCIEKSYVWTGIFKDERIENPRTDAPMWAHEELHELTEFMREVRNLLLLAELLPIEYTSEMQVSLQAFRNEDWLYKQFEEVLES